MMLFPLTRKDTGTVTDKNLLPISKMDFSSTGKSLPVDIGPLVCSGNFGGGLELRERENELQGEGEGERRRETESERERDGGGEREEGRGRERRSERKRERE